MQLDCNRLLTPTIFPPLISGSSLPENLKFPYDVRFVSVKSKPATLAGNTFSLVT